MRLCLPSVGTEVAWAATSSSSSSVAIRRRSKAAIRRSTSKVRRRNRAAIHRSSRDFEIEAEYRQLVAHVSDGLNGCVSAPEASDRTTPPATAGSARPDLHHSEGRYHLLEELVLLKQVPECQDNCLIRTPIADKFDSCTVTYGRNLD